MILRSAVTSLDVSVNMIPGIYPSTNELATVPYAVVRSSIFDNKTTVRTVMTQRLCDRDQPGLLSLRVHQDS
jgi:hypothetical protein